MDMFRVSGDSQFEIQKQIHGLAIHIKDRQTHWLALITG